MCSPTGELCSAIRSAAGHLGSSSRPPEKAKRATAKRDGGALWCQIPRDLGVRRSPITLAGALVECTDSGRGVADRGLGCRPAR